MGQLLGLAFGAWFWPWVFSAFFRAIGQKANAAAWTGFLVAAMVGAAIAAFTGFSPGSLGLFVLFGLAWTALRTRKAEDIDEAQEPNERDDPALRDLINNLEANPEASKPRKAKRAPRPGAPPVVVTPDEPPVLPSEPERRTCRACAEANDADAVHCVACGAALAGRICAGCEQVNVAKARFCKRCGGSL